MHAETAACSVCPARLRLAYPPFYRTFRFWYFTTILRCRYRPNVTSACAGAGAALQPSRATCQRPAWRHSADTRRRERRLQDARVSRSVFRTGSHVGREPRQDREGVSATFPWRRTGRTEVLL